MNNQKSIQSDEGIKKWLSSSLVSLSASMVFGRVSAGEIAKVHLKELFSIVENDYDIALQTVYSIQDFSVKRVLLEHFRHCFILISGDADFKILLEKIDFSQRQKALEYDRALLKITKGNGYNELDLTTKLVSLPITSKRAALNRLNHPDFKRHKKVHVRAEKIHAIFQPSKTENLVKWWHWLLIIIALSIIIPKLAFN